MAAQIAGSVGLAGSANIGDQVAMFEAIHGSAPRRAGQNLANPSGLLHGAIMMLVHLGQAEIAERVHNAWLKTIEDGLHTYDIYTEQHSQAKVGTREFADAVIARMGQRPEKLKAVAYRQSADGGRLQVKITPTILKHKETVGVDVFLHWRGQPDQLAAQLQGLGDDGLKLKMLKPVARFAIRRLSPCSTRCKPPVSISSRLKTSAASTANPVTRWAKESDSMTGQSSSGPARSPASPARTIGVRWPF